MAQWTVIPQAIAGNREIAELMTAGLHGERAADAADQLRLADAGRICLGVLPHLGQNATRCLSEGDFRVDGRATPMRSARDGAWWTWWRNAKHTGFIPGFVVDVDAVLAKNNEASVVLNEGTQVS